MFSTFLYDCFVYVKDEATLTFDFYMMCYNEFHQFCPPCDNTMKTA